MECTQRTANPVSRSGVDEMTFVICKLGMDGLDDDGNWPSRASSTEEKEEEVPTLDDFEEEET